MTRREQVKRFVRMVESVDRKGPPLDLDRAGAVVLAAELHTLWAREKLLEAVYEAAELCLAEDVRGGLALTKAIADLKKHDKENPR